MITEGQAVAMVNEELGSEMPKGTIEGLRVNGLLEDIGRGEPRAVADAAELVRKWHEWSGHPLHSADLPAVIDERAKRKLPLRIHAVSVLLATEAAREEDVISFRRDVLSGKLLSQEQVESWIEKQAARDGLPSIWVHFALPPQVQAEAQKGVLYLRPAVRRVSMPWSRSCNVLAYGVPGDHCARNKLVSETGVLGRLRVLAESLAERFTWQPAQATVFVLTGAVPVASLTRYGYHLRLELPAASRIKMTINPILSPAEVAAAYERARRAVLDGRYRNLSEKHLNLAIFMTDRPSGEKPKQSMAAWNKRYPRWKYREQTNFGRDCSIARRRLLHPPIRAYPRALDD